MELETFANVLERAVITLKENDSKSDLQGGVLHTMILEKIPERLLAQYYRWLNNNKFQESLETLKDWVSEEAAYQIQATEIKNGISPDDQVERQSNGRNPRSFFSNDNETETKCVVCTQNHPIWKCETFKTLSDDDRWKTARQCGLCYRCLGDDHQGRSCLSSPSATWMVAKATTITFSTVKSLRLSHPAFDKRRGHTYPLQPRLREPMRHHGL